MLAARDKIAKISLMTLFYNNKQKIRNTQRTIDVLLDGDFPLDSGKKALRKLRNLFDGFDKKLDRAQKLNDSSLVKNIASNVNGKVFRSLAPCYWVYLKVDKRTQRFRAARATSIYR
jgi:hypothetical protein